MKTKEKEWCPGWESNPHEEKSPEDFKSSASAIPPPGHRHYKSSEHNHLLQHHRLSSRNFGSSVATSENVQRWVLILCNGRTVRQRRPFSGREIRLGLSPGRVARGFEERGFGYTDEREFQRRFSSYPQGRGEKD